MNERIMGFVVGAVIGIVILAVFALVRRSKTNSVRCDFDERQLQARGKAFQYGFVTLLIYNVLYGALCEEPVLSWCDTTFGMPLGVGLALVVFGVYAVWNDAFMQLSQNPAAIILLFGVIGLSNLGLAVCHIAEGTLMEEGKLGIRGANLVLGVAFLIITIAFIIRNYLNQREED